jgi:hypothetical protein
VPPLRDLSVSASHAPHQNCRIARSGVSTTADRQRRHQTGCDRISPLGLRRRRFLRAVAPSRHARRSQSARRPRVPKATGLAAALDEIGLIANQGVGVGDSENDQASLGMRLSVAVANALPSVKASADVVTTWAARCWRDGTDRTAAGRLRRHSTRRSGDDGGKPGEVAELTIPW